MSFVKTVPIIILFFFAGLLVQSQNMLLLSRTGKYKNYKFYEGDQIHIKIKTDTADLQVRGVLNVIYDSSIIVNYDNVILTKDIITVYRPRWWARILSYSAIAGGVGYLALDVFNRAINQDDPILLQETLVTSGIIIGVGLLLIPFREHWYIVGEKWTLQALVL